jgi:lipopolysaccharide transport system permease protein
MGTGLVTSSRKIWEFRRLIAEMTKRDIVTRFKNSVLGPGWVIAQPLLQLMLYAFVFQVVLKAKWGAITLGGPEIPFGLLLFVGIILHTLLADTLVRGPSLIVSNASYVKKVIFPIELLPLINVASGVVSALFGIVAMLGITLAMLGTLSWSVLLLPIPLALLAIMTLGLGWLLSAIGVYVRDLPQLTSNLATIFLFTAPICYPAEMVPLQFRWLLDINPLTIPVEVARSLAFGNALIPWDRLAMYGLASFGVASFGLWVFNRMREGFADAL